MHRHPLLLLALGVASCSSSATTPAGGPDSGGRTDAGGKKTADGGRTDASGHKGTDGGRDAAIPRDSGVDVAGDALANHDVAPLDAGPPLYGDRNLGTVVSFPASAMAENGGCVIDLKSPPASTGIKAALGDGMTDDTAAFQSAYAYLKGGFVEAGSFPAQCTWFYLPAGTYLVSDTLIYPGASLEAPTGYVWDDIVGVRFIGQSRETVTIRLADSAAGFQDPANPKIVLAYQHPTTRFNNIPASNALENVTIDVGRGNSGAIALFFQGANTTEMNNVKLTSGDGMGAYGLYFHIGSVQGAYRDLTIEGFNDGVYQDQSAEVDESLEHITLIGQAVAGVAALGGGMTLRAALIDETATGANAILVDQSGAQVTVVDSELQGKASAAIEQTTTGTHYLFARNVSVRGFAAGIDTGGTVDVAGSVKEYLSGRATTLSSGQPTASMALPVKDAPEVPWFDPTTEWADVGAFGAKADGTTDDTAAIQMALRSGKPVVFFPRRAYKVTANLEIPATVRRVEAFFADLGGATFEVSETSATPVLIRETTGYGHVTSTAPRDVILQLTSGSYSNHAGGPLNLFIEDCANIGGDPAFTVAGQHTFARSINDEEGGGGTTFDPATQYADIQVAGGSLWVLTYKTENKPIPSFSARPGSFVEVLGGYVNVTANPNGIPMVVNDHANVSYIGTTNLFCNELTSFVAEIRDAGTATEQASSLPPRNFSSGGSPCYTVPLYVGYDPTAVPPP